MIDCKHPRLKIKFMLWAVGVSGSSPSSSVAFSSEMSLSLSLELSECLNKDSFGFEATVERNLLVELEGPSSLSLLLFNFFFSHIDRFTWACLFLNGSFLFLPFSFEFMNDTELFSCFRHVWFSLWFRIMSTREVLCQRRSRAASPEAHVTTRWANQR